MTLTTPPRPDEQLPLVEELAEREALIREARLRARRRRQGYLALAMASIAGMFAYVDGGGAIPGIPANGEGGSGSPAGAAARNPSQTALSPAIDQGRILVTITSHTGATQLAYLDEAR